MPNLPTVRIDDVLVHPRDNDLILATHSRGIWIMDDISALQALTPDTMAQGRGRSSSRATPCSGRPIARTMTEVPGDKWWEGEVAPRGTAIAYYLKTAPTATCKVTITNTATGQAVRTCIGTERRRA